LLGGSGDHGAALKCFEKVLEINPADVDALFSKAAVYVNLGNGEEAAKAFKRFIKVADPEDPRQAQARTLIQKLGA
jgi:tetratricopeptide (TPR) repeat protein